MLIRIVRMHFTEAGVDEFLDIFHQHKEAIRNFPGCTHLQLLKDAADPLCYTTLSHWEDPTDLSKYRKSELFASVWGRVKRLFFGAVPGLFIRAFYLNCKAFLVAQSAIARMK